MKLPLEKRIKKLEDQVQFLERQIVYLEEKLEERKYEKENQIKFTQQTPPPPVSKPTVESEERQTAPEQKKPYHSKPKKESMASSPIQWEKLIFQTLLPRIFIFIFILGVLWGLKAAYDFGIITIHIILALGILLSIVMAILGSIQINKDRRVLGQVLIGGSIPVFMLTVFSMHQLYYLIGPSSAFILNIIAIIAGIAFTYQTRSQSIGIITSIAGSFVPYLIESTEPNYYLFVSYEAVLYLLFLGLSLYLTFRGLYIVSTIFLHVTIFFLYIFTYVPDEYGLLMIFPVVIQQIALFGGLMLTKVSLRTQAFTVLASLMLTAIWVNSHVDTYEATAIFIGLTLLHSLGYFLFRKDHKRAPILIVNASLAFLFIFLINELDIAYEILLVITIIYLFYARKFRTQFHYVLAAIQYFIAFSLFNTYYVTEWLSYEMLHKITFLLTTAYMIYLLDRTMFKDKSNRQLLLIGLPYFALLLLFFSSDLTFLIVHESNFYEIEPLILSSFWVLIAIGYMLFSQLTKIGIGKFVGVTILLFTVAKVILLDISFLSMTLRAILFIGLGVIGLLISRVYSKK